MFRLNYVIITVILVLMFSTQITKAQTQDVMQFGNLLDQRARANGLPTGDGLVSPVEQSVASALINEITGFSQSVAELAQASPANDTWLEGVEQRMADYDAQMAAATHEPVDVRAEIISNAVAQYGQEIEAVETFDVRAQIISDAVAQYGKDAAELQAEAPYDPRASAISQAVAQYGKQVDALEAEAAYDPRASAISQAVAQYGQEVGNKSGQSLSPAVTQAIRKTVREGANDYINNSNIPRKILVIKHIDDMILSDFDKDNTDQLEVLPGFWRQTQSSVVMSGTCKSAAMGVGHGDGDNGGDAPAVPLTPICQSTAGDYLFIDGRPEVMVEPLLYSDTYTSRELVLENFTATGSINTSFTTEYQIVASDLIGVHKVYHEEGGCTIEFNSTYELVQQDTSVCAANTDYMDTPDPVSTVVPGATLEPTTAPQEIPPGTYPITWTVDSGTCTAETQPTFTEAQVEYTNNGDMLLRLGSDEHTLFAIGTENSQRYQFLSSERQINVQVLSGVIKMDWGKFAGMAMCFKGGELGDDSAPSATALPAFEPTPTAVAATNGQQYAVSFQPDESMCPQAVQDTLPNFDGATFEALPDGGYQLITGGETIPFKDNHGYAIYDGSNLSQGITYQIGLVGANDQGGSLSLMYMNASGAICLADLKLTAG